jgi:hypothetical protein
VCGNSDAKLTRGESINAGVIQPPARFGRHFKQNKHKTNRDSISLVFTRKEQVITGETDNIILFNITAEGIQQMSGFCRRHNLETVWAAFRTEQKQDERGQNVITEYFTWKKK